MSGSEKAYSQPLKLLNEGPEVIGCMATVLESGGSLDSAVREIAYRGPPCSSRIFRKMVEDSELRIEADLFAVISRMISELPAGCSAYGLALRMAVSASETKDPSERRRELSEASAIALSGLHEAGKTFSSGLNMPCMAVFGIGIMVPMVLMSIMPMMNISGLFGHSALDTRTVAVLTLVLIPAAVLALISGISSRNPLSVNTERGSPLELLPLLTALPLSFSLYTITNDLAHSICIGTAASAALTFLAGSGRENRERRRARAERELESSLLEIGNRLVTGSSFEDSIFGALSCRKELGDLAKDFLSEITICRGEVSTAIGNIFTPISPQICDVLNQIYRMSLKDLGDAGRLAMSVGKQIADRASIRKGIRNDLKSMTDTMFGTAAVFAPLVLGMSISMLQPLKTIAEGVDMGSTASLLSVYLVELSALIAMLLAFIEGNCTFRTVVRKASGMCAASLTVFMAVCSFSF